MRFAVPLFVIALTACSASPMVSSPPADEAFWKQRSTVILRAAADCVHKLTGLALPPASDDLIRLKNDPLPVMPYWKPLDDQARKKHRRGEYVPYGRGLLLASWYDWPAWVHEMAHHMVRFDGAATFETAAPVKPDDPLNEPLALAAGNRADAECPRLTAIPN